MDKKIRGALLVLCLLILFVIPVINALSVDNLLLKVSVQEGGSITKAVSISSEKGEEIVLDLLNLNGVSLSQKNLFLQAGEKRELSVHFDSKGIEPGVKVGAIKISGDDIITIPIIFEIESKDLFFDLNVDIPPQYTNIESGESIVAQIAIFDLVSGGTGEGLSGRPIDLIYSIYSIDGSVLMSDSETVIIDKETVITKTIVLPERVKDGDYVFAAVVDYNGAIGTSTHLFGVGKDGFGGGLGGLGIGANFQFLLIIILIFIFFIALLWFFVYLIRDRDKFILELKQYNEEELQMQKEYLSTQENVLKSKAAEFKSKKAAAEKEQEVKREIRQKIEGLKKKHEARIAQMHALKKKGEKDKMKKQLEEWKKEGYNTTVLDYKLKGLSTNDMENIIEEWRKKYKTEGYKKKK